MGLSETTSTAGQLAYAIVRTRRGARSAVQCLNHVAVMPAVGYYFLYRYNNDITPVSR